MTPSSPLSAGAGPGAPRRRVPRIARRIAAATAAAAVVLTSGIGAAAAQTHEPRTVTRFTLDTTFNTAAWDGGADASNVTGAALLTDGSVVLAGSLLNWGPTTTAGVQRFTTAGTFDTTFNTNVGAGPGAGKVRATLALGTGDVALAGQFSTFDGAPSGSVVVLNADGTRETTFASRLGGDVRALASTADGGLVVAGGALTFDGTPITSGVAKLGADGSLDTQFSAHLAGGLDASTPLSGSAAIASGVAIDESGLIYVTGNFTTFGGRGASGIVKLGADGTPDTTFSTGSGFNQYGLAITLDRDGGLIVGGAFTAFDGAAAPALVRLSTDGRLDTEFAAALGAGPKDGGNPGTVAAVHQLADGTILLGGKFTNVSGEHGANLYSLSSNGAPQRNSFAAELPSGVTQYVRAFADNPVTGTVVVAGQIGPHPGGVIHTPRGFYRLNLESLTVGPVDDQVTSLGAGVDLTVPATTYPVPNLPVTFSASGYPTGLSFDDATGAFSGAPTETGVFETTVTGTKVTGGLSETITFTWTVTTAPTIAGDAPDTAVGTTYPSYGYTLTGYPAPTVQVTSGTLPDGITLAPDGTFSGTATTAGTYAFTVTATNGTTPDATLADTITVGQAPTISGDAPDWTRGDTYPTFHYQVAGSPAPTVTVTDGALPGGLTLAADGTITGTPTATGTFAYTVTATNSIGSVTLDDQITITSVPTITGAAPDGVLGTSYPSFGYTVGGEPAPSVALADGSDPLPAGLTLNADGTITGTPTTTGTYAFTVEACNVVGSVTLDDEIVITSVPTIEGAAPDGLVGTAYPTFGYTLGGEPAPSVALADGSDPLPAGLTLNADGTITGTPTEAGTFGFTVEATNVAGSVTLDDEIVVHEAPSISGDAPDWTTGTAYPEFGYTLDGAPAPTTTVTAGALPDGLSLGTDGTIAGTPTTVGTFTYTVTASNDYGTATVDDTIVISSAPAVSGDAPDWTTDTPYPDYSYSLGGTPLPTVEVTAGSLPDGLTLDSTTGDLSGTPTTAGRFTYTLTATSTGGTATLDDTIVIGSTPSISGAAPDGVLGTAYPTFGYTLGGDPVPTVTLTSDSAPLPPGLTLGTDGTITGTPTATGTYAFTVRATVPGVVLTLDDEITVSSAPTIAGDAPDGVVTRDYTPFTYTLSGQPLPVDMTVTAGALPDGLTLDTTTGTIAGTPTVAGTFTFTVTATNPAGTATVDDTITIAEIAPTISGDPGDGVTWQDYAPFTFTVDGAPTPTVTVTDGDLPTGLSMDETGKITGTPTTAGTFAFTVTATNGVDPASSVAASITITAHPEEVVESPSLAAGDTQTVHGTGFSAGDTVTAVLGATPVDLGTLTADEHGNVDLTFTVPAGTTTGQHTVTLTGAVSGAASAAFQVTAPPSTGDVLAHTGAAIGGGLLLAAGLAIGGWFLLGAARRRRKHDEDEDTTLA